MSKPVLRRPDSLRLSGFDYRSAGLYFITICTYRMECTLGSVNDYRVLLSNLGELVERCWYEIPHHHQQVELDQMVIMPNHLHGILQINETRTSLGAIVGSFKSACSRIAGVATETVLPIWQRGFYDHIIRSEKALFKIRQYIYDNPARWQLDELNPDNTV